jgi:Dna[CI] antecedent, DciA
MRRLSDVLPSVASQLGLEDQLQQGRAIASWERLVAEHVPPASGASRLLEVRPPALIVSADDAFVAQELLLRSDELLTAFAMAPGGTRLLELRPVIQRPANRPRR